jgi:hypothetical protein
VAPWALPDKNLDQQPVSLQQTSSDRFRRPRAAVQAVRSLDLDEWRC